MNEEPAAERKSRLAPDRVEAQPKRQFEARRIPLANARPFERLDDLRILMAGIERIILVVDVNLHLVGDTFGQTLHGPAENGLVGGRLRAGTRKASSGVTLVTPG